MIKELKRILGDSYVMIIFIVGGFIYPMIYGIVYHKGTVDEMPIAVVDQSASENSRRFYRKLDATRELDVTAVCSSMDEAKNLMQKRKVHGIVFFPSDYDERLANMEQATVSTYADMASFLYYKDLTIGGNHVMINELKTLESTRLAATGMTESQVSQFVESIPYNTNFSFLIFFLSAAVILVVQQTMFYGISVMNGSLKEKGTPVADSSLLGRASAYGLIYIGICCYAFGLVPALFGMPLRGRVVDMLIMIFFFIISCLSFSFTFSRFIRRRETVFVVLLFMSSVCLFLSGCAWPTTAFPSFWKAFSYIFPSPFAIQGFNNIYHAGCTTDMIRPQIIGLIIQFAFYSVTAFVLHMNEKNAQSYNYLFNLIKKS